MLKKAVTPGSFLKNYLFTLLIVFLPLFMFGVFGPSEIFSATTVNLVLSIGNLDGNFWEFL